MIILVGGLPGSGKTYFATKLATEINATLYSSDKVRKVLHVSGKYNIADKLDVYTELARLAESALANKNSPVIVDATFSHHRMRILFKELAEKHNVKFLFIWLYADDKIVKARTSIPRPDSDADFQVYEKIRNQFEPIIFHHLVLESTDANINEMLTEAQRYIKENERE